LKQETPIPIETFIRETKTTQKNLQPIKLIKARRMRWAGHVARMGEKRNAFRLLVGKPGGRRPLGRPRRGWVDIRMDLVEVGWGDVDWLGIGTNGELL
jgi:hypothetical protein